MASISQMTTEQRLEDLETELQRAKRRNRLLLAVVLLAAIVMTAGIARRENVIKANAFVLLDENGKTRAALDVGKDGPKLGLYDENGKLRAGLSVGKDGSGLALSDENEKRRAGLAVVKEGPGLILADENEKPRVGLGVSKDGPRLELFDEKGEVAWAVDQRQKQEARRQVEQQEPDGTQSWRRVKQWKGRGIKETESFPVKSGEWRISWKSMNGPGVLQIFVYSDEGNMVATAANTLGTGSDTSYVRAPAGRFYLMINSANVDWEVVVEEQY